MASFSNPTTKAASIGQGDAPVTDDAIAKNILKFVRQLDGVDTEEGVLEAAIAHRWLDEQGMPTPDGRRLIDSFDVLQKIGRPTI